MKTTYLWLLLGLLLTMAACVAGGGSSSQNGDDDEVTVDDDVSDDADDDADDDAADNDTADDDTADDDTSDPSPSFNYGLVHYHYYGDLGGYDGETFRNDQAWAARHVDLAIMSYNDEPMEWTWDEIQDNNPRGRWLVWQLAHLFNTNEAAGTCIDPEVGGESATFAAQNAEFASFLAEYPAHGDGEECFLHARYDGQIGARWHGGGCDVILTQRGLEGSAVDEKDARLFSLVWDQYGWLLNVESDCARDYAAWRAAAQMDEGFAGPGYDNLGSPMEDRFYLPELVDAIDIIEIDDAQETSTAALNEWYYPAVDGLLTAVHDALPGSPALLFNGATYCSWEGSIPQMVELIGPGVGVWCENALQYPAWGALGTEDRLAALIDLSQQAHDAGGFVALETFYGGDGGNPTADETMFYLAAFYVFKNGDDVMAVKPSWAPYEPFTETLWFGVFERDLGEPTDVAADEADGVFTRPYRTPDGTAALVVVRVDGSAGAVDFDLGGTYQRVLADNSTVEVSGVVSLASGDGLILLAAER